MKKFYFAALLFITSMTANAQEPNIPRGMFGGQPIDVKFNEYKAAPARSSTTQRDSTTSLFGSTASTISHS